MIANMSSIVTSLDKATRAMEEEMDMITAYTIERKLPAELSTRLRKFYK